MCLAGFESTLVRVNICYNRTHRFRIESLVDSFKDHLLEQLIFMIEISTPRCNVGPRVRSIVRLHA